MTRAINLVDELNTIRRDIDQLKTGQLFSGSNAKLYIGSEAGLAGDSSYFARYGYSIFTGTTPSIELMTTILIDWESVEFGSGAYYEVSGVSVVMAQNSTNKDVAKYESSWMVVWTKNMTGFAGLTIDGTIIARTQPTVISVSHGTSF